MQIILINGKSRSGKSTVGEELAKIYTNMGYRAKVLNNSKKVLDIAKEEFNWDGIKDEKARELFRGITHTGYKYDKNLWEKKSLEEIRGELSVLDFLIVPDWRYLCTYEFWKERNYKITTIKVETNRDNMYSEKVTKDDVGQLNNFNFDYYIFNMGTLEELKEKVLEVVNFIERD